MLDGSLSAGDLGVAGPFTLAPGTITGGTCVDQVVDVQGIKAGNRITLTAPRDVEPGLMAMPLTPDVDGKLPLRLCNFSGGDFTFGSKTWLYLAI